MNTSINFFTKKINKSTDPKLFNSSEYLMILYFGNVKPQFEYTYKAIWIRVKVE